MPSSEDSEGIMHEVSMVDDIDLVDFTKVTALLKDAYWSIGITRDEVLFGAKNSTLVVGAYLDDVLVGYLRVISDRVRFAYLLDVIVAPEYRKQGIGSALVRYAMAHGCLKLVYQWLLRTRDAQGVYDRIGFRNIDHPEQWMIIQHERSRRESFPADEKL